MAKTREEGYAAIEDLIVYLRSIEGESRGRALRGADLIAGYLTTLRKDFDLGSHALAYGLGGKGLLDWRWTKAEVAEIQRRCHGILGWLLSPDARSEG
ncbi:MAG: hypothetical protein AAGN66_17755 [Acidobacteriota bacterium]